MSHLSLISSKKDDGKVVTFPNSPFRLHQPFPPSGDQPEAIDKLVEGIDDGLSFQTLLGVTGSGKTYTMANVIARLGRPAIVFAPNKTLAAQLYSEFREFFPENAVEYFVSYYDYYQPEAYVPQRDLFIEKDSAINEHIEQMRLSCTKSLMERRDVVIVATVSAIYGIGNPNEYHQMILTLRTHKSESKLQRISTVHINNLKRIHSVSKRFRHFASIRSKNKTVYNTVLESRLVEQVACKNCKCIEPTTSLVKTFRNKISREMLFKIILVFKRIMLLSIRHAS